LRALGVYLGVFPIYAGFVSGGERHFIEFLKRAKIFEFDVITTRIGTEVLKANSVKAKTYIISVPFEKVLCKSIGIGLSILYFLRIIKAILLVCSLSREYNIICSSTHFIYDVLIANLASMKSKAAKTIVYLHHLGPPPLMRARYHPIIPSFLLWTSQSLSLSLIKRNGHSIVTYPFVKKILLEMRFHDERIKVMYSGVEVQTIQSKKAMYTEESGNGYDACFLGRLAPLKGIFDLIDIWIHVCQRIPNARLVIMGWGQEKFVSRLKEIIKSTSLTNKIILLGPVNEEEKYPLLKSCKIFVHPSYEEGWGTTVCEAIVCGLPVVGYNIPAYEFFDGAIIKVPMGNIESFSKKTIELLMNDDLRAEMSKKAINIAQRFSWNNVIKRELNIMKVLVKNGTGDKTVENCFAEEK